MSLFKNDNDIKTYSIKNGTNKDLKIEEKEFKLYSLTPKMEELKKYRKKYIESIAPIIFYKVLSNNDNWFYKTDSIYNNEQLNKLFEFAFLKSTTQDPYMTHNFIEYGFVKNLIHAVKYEGENYYFYTLYNIEKSGKTYRVNPVIALNEEIYNLSQVYLGLFNNVTVNDISQFKDLFVVSDEPKAIFKESLIEDKYRSRLISLEEYNEKMASFEKECALVKTLKK